MSLFASYIYLFIYLSVFSLSLPCASAVLHLKKLFLSVYKASKYFFSDRMVKKTLLVGYLLSWPVFNAK